MRHEARLDAPVKSGGTLRSNYRDAARQGNQVALGVLRNPHAFPEPLRYLHGIARTLYGRSGFSEVGMKPLTWESYDAWARVNGCELESHEIDALFAIVSVMHLPEEDA